MSRERRRKVLFLAGAACVVAWVIWLATVAATVLADVRTTATCYDLQGTTASGTYVNRRTAAHNFIPFRTKIRITSHQAGPMGIRRYIIRDTGPALSDGHVDLWSFKGVCGRYGVRRITFKFGWGRPRR